MFFYLQVLLGSAAKKLSCWSIKHLEILQRPLGRAIDGKFQGKSSFAFGQFHTLVTKEVVADPKGFSFHFRLLLLSLYCIRKVVW
jgi:hypothetical protein